MRSSISWSYSIEAIAKLLRKNNLIVRHTQNDLSAVTNLGYPRFHIKIWRKKENKITVDVHQDIAPHRGRNTQQSRKLLSKILTQLRSIQSNSRKKRKIYRLSWGNKSEKDAEGGIAL